MLQKHSIATITQLPSLEILIAKTPLLHMFYYMNWLTHELWLEQEGGSLIAPMALAHPLHLIDNRPRNRRRNLWLDDVFPPDDLCSRPEALVNIYICILYMSSVIGCIYIYIQQDGIQHWWSCTLFYRTVFHGSARFLGWIPLFVFFGLPIVSCSMINNLILECLCLLAFVLNNFLILGIWCSAISLIPGCFCPWTFFQNIGNNMVPSGPFMSHPTPQLGYSAGEFQALQLIVHAAFGAVD